MATDLLDLSNALSSIVRKNAPSVVQVDARRRAPASGTVWAPGVVVTSSHAIERDQDITVLTDSGRRLSATLAGRDPTTDIAVLKTDAADVPLAAWIEGDVIDAGNLVLALARPYERIACSMGIVGALGDAWRSGGGGKIDRWLELDLDLRSGFSGGALIDMRGDTVGLLTSGLVRGRSLAIPTSTVRRVVATLLSKGQVQRGFLGIGSHPVRLPEKVADAEKHASALIVVSVQPDGPADKAGILIGDVLLALDNKPLVDVGELVSLLDEDRIGKTASLRILRAGEIKDVVVTVGARSWS